MPKIEEAAPAPKRRSAMPAVPLADRMAWSVPEFAALFGMSEATAWRRIRSGELSVRRTCGRTLITRDAVEAWKAGPSTGRFEHSA